ncbi:unnamed protein product [Linum trigynum]|uniref:Uncharacterized protein n=1 Tax=Linum trigynum TaxID=586398 RepID=A0AAV2FJE0_9ROSI
MLFLVPIREMARIQSKPLVRHGSLARSCLRRWRWDGSAGSGELLATTRTGDGDAMATGDGDAVGKRRCRDKRC